MQTENNATVSINVDLNNQTVTKALANFFLEVSGQKVGIFSEVNDTEKAIVKEAKAKVEKTKPAETPEAKEESKTSEEPAKEEAPTHDIKLEDVRALVQAKVGAGHRDEIKKKLTSYKANNVTNVDPKFYPEFMEYLNTLA